MNIVVLPNQAAANGFSASLDARLGYPRAAIDIGGGMHVDPTVSRTLTAAAPIQHPTLLTRGVPETPEIVGVVGVTVPLPGGATVQPFDSSWFPAVVGVGS